MAIAFACACGKKLAAKDEFAGKKTKCPGCGVLNRIPVPEPEVIEVADIEVIEDEVAEPVEAVAATPPAVKASAPSTTSVKTKKKAKKTKQDDERGAMARMYMEHAEKDFKAKEKRRKAAPSWGRDEDGGFMMFGVHLSAGVIGAASMLLLGIIAMIVVGFFPSIAGRDYRIMLGAIGCTAGGAIGLIKTVFFGEED